MESRDNSSSIQIINKNISFIENNNQLISSFSYTSIFSNFTKYIALHLKPIFNISHITAEFEYLVTSIDLIDVYPKKIDNLINNETYLFFIEAVECTNKYNSIYF